METMRLKYQTVVYPDQTVAIHETTIDNDGNVTSASYDAVRLEAPSAGELEQLLRQVYRCLTKSKAITTEELEAILYKSDTSDDDVDVDDISNVVSLVDYLGR